MEAVSRCRVGFRRTPWRHRGRGGDGPLSSHRIVTDDPSPRLLEQREPRYVRSSPLRTIILGTIGSLLMMVGSFGIGWLAPASPLRLMQWVIPLRFNET